MYWRPKMPQLEKLEIVVRKDDTEHVRTVPNDPSIEMAMVMEYEQRETQPIRGGVIDLIV